jgi:hypothetical protein
MESDLYSTSLNHSKYDQRDNFNVDEFELFLNMLPDKSLAIFPPIFMMSVRKKYHIYSNIRQKLFPDSSSKNGGGGGGRLITAHKVIIKGRMFLLLVTPGIFV